MTDLKEVQQKTFLQSGLRNICHDKNDWFFLIFYDIDKEQLTQSDLIFIDNTMLADGISYIVYQTKHGYHVIGLTPLVAIKWARVYTKLKEHFNGYYSGTTIRWKLKQEETQLLIHKNIEYGDVIPNLYNLYARRFNYDKLYWTVNAVEYEKNSGKTWYGLVFEKYRSYKE